jgi:hypothetical protein
MKTQKAVSQTFSHSSVWYSVNESWMCENLKCVPLRAKLTQSFHIRTLSWRCLHFSRLCEFVIHAAIRQEQ